MFYRAKLPDTKIKLSHEHSEYELVSVDDIQKQSFNTSAKFKDAIKKADKDRKND